MCSLSLNFVIAPDADLYTAAGALQHFDTDDEEWVRGW